MKRSKPLELQAITIAAIRWSFKSIYGQVADAIHHLYRECSMRETGIQEFFSEGNIVPLTIVYEDFIQEYEKTVRKILEFLELNLTNIEIPHPLWHGQPIPFQKNGHKDFVKSLRRVWLIEIGKGMKSKKIHSLEFDI